MAHGQRVAIAGFGNVGQAVTRLIAEGHPSTEGIVVVAVSDPRFGTVVSQDHLDPETLLRAADGDGFAELPGYMADADVLDAIAAVDADTLIELTFTDLVTGEPATTHIRTALETGLNVSTTNKGPIALHLDDLERTAEANDVILAFEGTVMSGSPTVLLTSESIRGAGFRSALGILNGTTNHIISEMGAGSTFEQALADAQERGYAEADPTGDIEGIDAAGKLVILARILTDEVIPLDRVGRTSLRALTSEDVVAAQSTGRRWKYLASLTSAGSRWEAKVEPRLIDQTHPLASVDGPTNAITYETELLGAVTLVGPGAGRAETAYAVLSDLDQIAKGRRR
ncbi:MAG: homoserine dehydrogenase [Acidimicrobiia bacterium]